MHLNLLHRVSTGDMYPYFLLQQDYAHQLGLKVTVMVQVDAMQDPRIVADLRRFRERHGDEIGLSLSLGYDCPEFRERIGGPEEFLWLYAEDEKRFIIEMAVDHFRKAFGHDPVSVASYHLDAASQRILKAYCPAVRIAVAGCFEEGVKVFHGCNNSWYLFNEGMPWGPWYPAKDHTLRPAADESEWTGILGVPHLSRDTALSYEGRNDFFASHPANAQRGLANVGYDHPYDYNLCDMYRMQEDHNQGFSYYNVFVSPGWLAGHPTIQDPNEVSQKLYHDLLAYFVELRGQGRLVDMHMAEFADWYRAERPIGKPEVYLAKEMLYGSGKHYFWYVGPDMRCLVDTTQGGSIGDLRPYIGRHAACPGSDTTDLWYGSYPYVIQSIYRSGMSHHFLDGARTTLFATLNGETVDLGTCRTRVASVVRDATGTTLTLGPAELRFPSGATAAIETVYQWRGDGGIGVSRRLLACSLPGASLQVREQVKGCYGVTEYPEDLRGCTLAVDGQTISYAYRRRTLTVAKARKVEAILPQITTRVALVAESPTVGGTIIEGLLFSPFYTLALDYALSTGQAITSCLKLSDSRRG